MNFKRIEKSHIIAVILFFSALSVFLSEPDIYGHLAFQLFFWLILIPGQSLIWTMESKISKIKGNPHFFFKIIKRPSFSSFSQLIFYFFLLFTLQHYIFFIPYNMSYLFNVYFFIITYCVLIFGFLFMIHFYYFKK